MIINSFNVKVMAFRRLSLLIGNRWIMYQSIDIFSNKLLKSSGALEMSFHNFHFYILQYFFYCTNMIINFQWFWHSAFNLIKYSVRALSVRKTTTGPIRGQVSGHVICHSQSEASSPPSFLKNNLGYFIFYPKLPEN